MNILVELASSEVSEDFNNIQAVRVSKRKWKFVVGNITTELRKEEIRKALLFGSENYLNYLDGYKLFVCKILGKCSESEEFDLV